MRDDSEYKAYIGDDYSRSAAAIYQDYQIWGQGNYGLPSERIGAYKLGTPSYLTASGNGVTVNENFSGTKPDALRRVVQLLLKRNDVTVKLWKN